MSYKTIDMSSYPRRGHLEHFKTMANPMLALTVQVDITEWFERNKAAGRPFFLSFQYAVVQAANTVPQLRQRIRNSGIIEYDFCNPSYTVALSDGTYRYCSVDANRNIESYLALAEEAQKSAMDSDCLTEHDDPESYFFISCLPWISYSSHEMPFPDSSFSVPSITWGKFYTENVPLTQDGRIVLKEVKRIPVTIMANHAIVDGKHISDFFDALSDELKK